MSDTNFANDLRKGDLSCILIFHALKSASEHVSSIPARFDIPHELFAIQKLVDATENYFASSNEEYGLNQFTVLETVRDLDKGYHVADLGFYTPLSLMLFGFMVHVTKLDPQVAAERVLQYNLRNDDILAKVAEASAQRHEKAVRLEEVYKGFRDMNKPAPEGTVKELAEKYGKSISEIRKLKREGQLHTLVTQ